VEEVIAREGGGPSGENLSHVTPAMISFSRTQLLQWQGSRGTSCMGQEVDQAGGHLVGQMADMVSSRQVLSPLPHGQQK